MHWNERKFCVFVCVPVKEKENHLYPSPKRTEKWFDDVGVIAMGASNPSKLTLPIMNGICPCDGYDSCNRCD